jgi:CDP-diacylglycerol--glycerol-3-phosphate 3-phosphatidyltransferase
VEAHWTVPNALTVTRIGLAAAAAAMALSARAEPLAVAILILAALLDAFDGWYARAFAQSTRLGKHLDPFADKVLVGVILVWIACDARSPVVWALAGASIARDAAMTALRMYSVRARRRLIPASPLGRVKMFIQSAGGLVILSFTHILGWSVPVGIVIAALAVMVIVSVAAMVGYLKAKGPAADHEQTHFALRSPG